MEERQITISFTDVALEDLQDIEDYISIDSPRLAQKFIERIFMRIEQLTTHPTSGKIAPEFNNDSLRELLLKKYRIIYLLSGSNEVVVLRVIQGRAIVGFRTLTNPQKQKRPHHLRPIPKFI